MLLVIDIGNTNIVVGVYQGQELVAHWRIATDRHRMADEYAMILLNLFAHNGLSQGDITGVVISSVVPPLTPTFEELTERYFGLAPLVVRAGVKTGVRILYDNPKEVGADRIVNAMAAYRLYGGPCIVIDFGTATTFDVISADGDYLGGAIAPGIRISAEALYERTSALPRISLVRPAEASGRNTIASMQSGLIFGYVGLIEGLIQRIKQELGPARVVATGGLAEIIAKETPLIELVDQKLTIYGLLLLHELNKEQSQLL